jgi:dephospho-CoA kinase
MPLPKHTSVSMRKRSCARKKIILGLTGSFGSGKTRVAAIFKSYGAKVVDADKIVRRVSLPGEAAYKNIVRIFGKGFIGKDKRIDRVKLAARVFNNKALLIKLNKAVHPEVIRVIKKEISRPDSGVIVVDAPLLIEAGLKGLMDKLVVVKISRKNQFKRIFKKMRITKSAVLERLKAQMPLENKVRLADFVIDNDGSIENTRKQVKQIRRMLWRS